jgi:hypothetical protein
MWARLLAADGREWTSVPQQVFSIIADLADTVGVGEDTEYTCRHTEMPHEFIF